MAAGNSQPGGSEELSRNRMESKMTIIVYRYFYRDDTDPGWTGDNVADGSFDIGPAWYAFKVDLIKSESLWIVPGTLDPNKD